MTPNASPDRTIADLSVTLVDSVSGRMASHVVDGARIFPLGNTSADMSMVRVQAAVMQACRRAADVLGGAYSSVVAEPSVRIEHPFLDGIEAAGAAFTKAADKASISVDAAKIATAVDTVSNEIAVRAAREAIVNVRRIGAKAEGLSKFFDGATVTALGEERVQRDAGQSTYLRLAAKLAAVGAISAIGISLSSGASAANFVRPSPTPFVPPPVRQAPATVPQQQPRVVQQAPAFQQRQAAPVASQSFARPAANPLVAPPVRQATPNAYAGNNNGYAGNNGYNGNNGNNNGYRHNGGAGAFVGGLLAGTLLGSGVGNAYPTSSYPNYGYQPNYGNGYAQRYGAYGTPAYGQGYGNQGYGAGYPIPPDRSVILAAKAIVAVALGSVLIADERVDHAMAAAQRCMAISRGTRPCGVRMPGVEMDFARGFYEVDALGVSIVRQEGNRLTLNQVGLDEALHQAKGVQIHEQDSAEYGAPGPGRF